MKKNLIYKDEKSDKFWKIEVKDNTHEVNYGKAGSKGTTKTKTFDTKEEAQKDAEKLVAQKEKKGYIKAPKVPKGKKTPEYTPPKKGENNFEVNWDSEAEVMLFMNWLANNPRNMESRGSYRFSHKGNDIELFDFWRKITTYPNALPLLEKYVSRVNGGIWADDESPLGQHAALALGLAGKQYIGAYISYITTTDMNHEVYQGEHIDMIAEKHGNCTEIRQLMAYRSLLPAQHGVEQLEDFMHSYGINNPEKIQDMFNHIFLAAKNIGTRSDRVMLTLELIGYELPKIWENAIGFMVDEISPNNLYTFESIFFYLNVLEDEETKVPEKLSLPAQHLYLDLVEVEITKNKYAKAELLSQALENNELSLGQNVVKHFLHSIAALLSGKDKIAASERTKLEAIMQQSPDMSCWNFKEIKAWQEIADLNDEQKNTIAELTALAQGGTSKMHHFAMREGYKCRRWSAEVFPKKIVENGKEHLFETEADCSKFWEELLEKKKAEGYFPSISKDDRKYLMEAIENSELKKIKFYVERGAQLDLSNAWLVCIAQKKSTPEVYEYLLNHLIENHTEFEGEDWRLYNSLSETKNQENVRILLTADYRPENLESIHAQEYLTPENFNLFIQKVPNWLEIDTYRWAYYCTRSNIPLLEELLKYDIKIGLSPVHTELFQEAIKKELDLSIIKKIEEKGGWLFYGSGYSETDDGEDEFNNLIKNAKNPALKEYLVQVKKKQETGFHIERVTSHIQHLKTYLKEGGDVNWQDEYGWSLLHYVCSKRAEWIYQPFVKLLLENGINPNLKDKFGRTAAFYINYINKLDYQMATLIKKAGGNLEIMDNFGDTAILYRMKNDPKHPSGIKCVHDDAERRLDNAYTDLMNAGVNVNFQDTDGNTVLHLMGNVQWPEDKIEDLVEAGADGNIQNKKGQTILHIYSIDKGLNDSLGDNLLETVLAQKNLNVNLQDENGNTFMHFAAIHKKRRYIEDALEHVKPDITIKNNAGQLAEELMEANGIMKKENIVNAMKALKSSKKVAFEEKWLPIDLSYSPEVKDVEKMEVHGLYPPFNFSEFHVHFKCCKEALFVHGKAYSTQTGDYMYDSSLVEHAFDEESIAKTSNGVARIKNKTGEILWEYQETLYDLTISDHLLIGYNRKGVTALDIDSGEEIWSNPGLQTYSYLLVYKNQVWVLPQQTEKGLVLNKENGETIKEIDFEERVNAPNILDEKLWYLSKIDSQVFQIKSHNFDTGETQTFSPESPKHIWRSNDLYIVDGKILTVFNSNNKKEKGIYELMPDGNFEHLSEVVFVVRTNTLIGDKCLYICDGKEVIEVNVETRQERRLFLGNHGRNFCLYDKKLLILNDAGSNKMRLNVVV